MDGKARLVLFGVGGAVAALAGAAAFLLWRRHDARTYAQFDTRFGKARIYQVADDAGESVRLLEVGGIVQSGTYLDERYDELVFDYLKRYDALFEGECEARDVLVLGCGGYDYPEHLIAHHPEVVVDAVEVDPAITAIARHYFYLDRLIEEYETERTGCLNLICDDALHHLLLCGKRYDAVVNDTFDAGTPPAHLTTATFLQAVRDHLNPGGMFLTNIVAPLEGPGSKFLCEQAALVEEVFGNVRIEPCAEDDFGEPDNVIVIARKM